ncbi:MAG TPA: outer membrane beta-barrel protein [Arachidicoccus sp.]|nr:outer membrane beta-barrel protein [Arachidicoccus sp.]
MYLKLLTLGLFLIFSTILMAQQDSVLTEHESALSWKGSVDFYYKHGLGNKEKGMTSFTQSDRQFQLGMASVQLKYTQPKTDIVVDLGFGPRARDFSYADEGAMAAIKQAYIDYKPLDGLVLTAGTWATHIGYELLDPAGNQNYSMSYMFSTGPFSNTGFKAAYGWKQHQVMVGVSNPTDYRTVPDSMEHKPNFIAQYHYDNGKGLAFYLNYTGGKQVDSARVQQLDMVVSSSLGKYVALGVNGTVGFRKPWEDGQWLSTKKWWGAALYLKGTLSDQFDLAFREEYFVDESGITAAPIEGNVWSSTLTASYKIGNLRIMPELRIDKVSRPIFADGKSSNPYLLLAAVYQF